MHDACFTYAGRLGPRLGGGRPGDNGPDNTMTIIRRAGREAKWRSGRCAVIYARPASRVVERLAVFRYRVRPCHDKFGTGADTAVGLVRLRRTSGSYSTVDSLESRHSACIAQLYVSRRTDDSPVGSIGYRTVPRRQRGPRTGRRSRTRGRGPGVVNDPRTGDAAHFKCLRISYRDSIRETTKNELYFKMLYRSIPRNYTSYVLPYYNKTARTVRRAQLHVPLDPV